MNQISHDCPLCGGPAVYYDVDHGERHYYSCQSCSKFLITITAERRLQGTVLQSLAEQARAATSGNDEHVLEVRWGIDPSRSLEASIVQKADYRL